MSAAIFIDSIVALACRGSLFYACYRSVLSAVYHDLRSLSAPNKGTGDADAEMDEIELNSIPHPNTSAGQKASMSLLTHSNVARLSFSLCFSESCVMFLLFMCQEIGLLSARGRYLNWRISLAVLLAVILVTIPLSQNILLTYHSPLGSLSRSRSMPTRVALALVPYAIYMFLLALIPLPESLGSKTIVSAALSRLIVLGTFIIGVLSGIGAARYIWEHIPLFRTSESRTPTPHEICAAEDALQRVRNDLIKRQKEETRLVESDSSKGASWMSRVTSTLTGSSELTSLQREIDGLRALEYQMDRNLEEMRKLVSASKYNETIGGRILHIAGTVFAVYCVFRSISCILNLISPFNRASSPDGKQRSYTDLIAHFLTYLVSLLPFIHLSAERISAISRQLSLALVGVIIASSVRFVLRAVTRFLRITSRNLGASLLLLILAQLMGTYLISTLVQLRTAFPPDKETFEGSDLYNVLSTLPAYEVFGSAFDISYLLSAIVTGIYLWFDDRINRSSLDI